MLKNIDGNKSWKKFLLVGVLLTVFIGETYYSGLLSYYYTHFLGLPLKTQAIAWSVFVAISIPAGIFVGIISDRFVGHSNGRRIPFIRVGGLLLGIVFSLAFSVQIFHESNTALAINYVLVLVILFILETLVGDSLLAIPSEEISDKNKRSETYILIGIASGLGLGAFLLVSPLQSNEKITSSNFGVIMAAIGIFASVFYFLSSYFLPHTFVQEPDVVRKSNPIKSFLECFKNKTFLIGEIYLTAIVCSTSINLIGFFYYITEVFSNFSYLTILGFPLGALFTWFFFKKYNGKISKRYIYGIPAIVAATALLSGAALGNLTVAPVAGFFGGGVEAFIQYTFNNMIITEAVDEDVKHTGIRKEAQYIGLDYIFDSIGSLCQSLFSIIILSFGYIEGLDVGLQTIGAQQGIIFATLVFPALIILIGTVIMLIFYHKEK